MKEWLIKFRFENGCNNKRLKKCKICSKQFLSNGPTLHCSWKCFLILKRNINEKGCWIWKGSLTNKGYGKTSASKMVHRISYNEFRGDIPEGIFVCHVCDEPSCFNPEHLFLGNQKDNMQDCSKKGRRTVKIGIEHQWTKLNEEEVKKIKIMIRNGMQTRQIAKIMNLSENWVSKIKHGKAWIHINI